MIIIGLRHYKRDGNVFHEEKNAKKRADYSYADGVSMHDHIFVYGSFVFLLLFFYTKHKRRHRICANEYNGTISGAYAIYQRWRGFCQT